MTNKTITVMGHKIGKEQISSLLISALEGGSNFWYFIEQIIPPKKWEFESEPKDEYGRHYLQDYALNPGGALVIISYLDDGPAVKVDWEQVQKGLKIMAEKYPELFFEIVNENADANTGDCFLQCCVFGEAIYG